MFLSGRWTTILNYTLAAILGLLLLESLIAETVLSPANYASSFLTTTQLPAVQPAAGPASSIGKVFLQYGDYNEMYERALATHNPHNTRFGYRTSILRSMTLPKFWSKPAYILKLLLDELEKPADARLEWLFWFDSDVVLLNPFIPLELYLPPRTSVYDSYISCVASQDHRGLNNGVFALRVNVWSVNLMAATISTPAVLPRLHLSIGDQSAMEYWLQSSVFRNGTMHVPQRWFNAYPGRRGNGNFSDPALPQSRFKANSVREGDLAAHFAGHKEMRERFMTPWLEVAERHDGRWEREDISSLREEVRKWWDSEAQREWERVEEFRQRSGYTYPDKETWRVDG